VNEREVDEVDAEPYLLRQRWRFSTRDGGAQTKALPGVVARSKKAAEDCTHSMTLARKSWPPYTSARLWSAPSPLALFDTRPAGEHQGTGSEAFKEARWLTPAFRAASRGRL